MLHTFIFYQVISCYIIVLCCFPSRALFPWAVSLPISTRLAAMGSGRERHPPSTTNTTVTTVSQKNQCQQIRANSAKALVTTSVVRLYLLYFFPTRLNYEHQWTMITCFPICWRSANGSSGPRLTESHRLWAWSVHFVRRISHVTCCRISLPL